MAAYSADRRRIHISISTHTTKYDEWSKIVLFRKNSIPEIPEEGKKGENFLQEYFCMRVAITKNFNNIQHVVYDVGKDRFQHKNTRLEKLETDDGLPTEGIEAIGKTSVMYKGLYDNDRVLQYAHSLNVCNKEMEIMEKLDLACFLKIPDLNLADYGNTGMTFIVLAPLCKPFGEWIFSLLSIN
ncbi:19477_t:CDS:2 [Entrophospora sp. SA101]|nr:13693_t:CDS:2 [Entrophospora sp. SA101]CAJ0766897.1 19477_t:CDS:2 [Entrophospora sp. SA101]CAJ0925772.1 8199_t:CDS:2 [Entrophospora sp. SA101]CAJ0925785.1 8205_t:CDS:2 [Entrophospora sp. SA101]CAJ0925786.1 8206_t:CDS:2 [Entrophospora sp. SA101]